MAAKLEGCCQLGFHAAAPLDQAEMSQVKVELEELPAPDSGKGPGGDHRTCTMWTAPIRASTEAREGLPQHWAVQWLEELKASQVFAEAGQASTPKNPQLPQLSPGADIKIYLSTFERVAAACGWPKVEWVTRLVPLLSKDAQQAYNSLDPRDAGDYVRVKAAILQGDTVSMEMRHRRFRQFRYHEVEGPREACSLLWELARYWLKPESRTKEQILELLVLEQFLMVLPEEMQRWVWECHPETCAQAVALAEEFQGGQLKVKAWEDQVAMCVKVESMTPEIMHPSALWESSSSQPSPDGVSEQEEGQSEYDFPGVPGKEPRDLQETAAGTLRAASLRKQRAVNWGEKETRAFLSIWGQERIQKMLQHQYRNEEVYKKIAMQMVAMGYDRDWEQCRQRAKVLRRGYKDVKDQNRCSGHGRQVWQYFEALDAILGPLFELGNGYDGENGADDLQGHTYAGGSVEPDSSSSAQLAESDQNGPWAAGLQEGMDNSLATFQRAANWGEKETRDFLGIWGRKRVQRLLHQQHWNEDVYKEVSAEMAALGYGRDWEQCRQRAKDLRRGYKDVKDHNRRSARGRKVWQYFEELDVILGQRVGTEAQCDPGGVQNWGEDPTDEGLSVQNASPMGAQDPDQIDTSGSSEEVEDSHLPCQRAAKWGEKETRDFLGIWGQDRIQSLLHHQHRNEEVYRKIAADMAVLGYERDWEQCRQRAKDLRRGYREAKEHNRCSGRGRQMWQYVEELDVILRRWYEMGSGHTEEEMALDGTYMGMCAQGSPGHHHGPSQTWTTSPAEASNSLDTQAWQSNETIDCSQTEPVGSQTPGQRAARWGERETRDFLSIWGHESVQSQLRQQYRNEEVYKQIAAQMAALGYDRDWEQCRQRAKDLRRSYRDAKDQNRRYGRGRQVWQYFEELDAILGHWGEKGGGHSEGEKAGSGTASELRTRGSASPSVLPCTPTLVLGETRQQRPAMVGKIQLPEEAATKSDSPRRLVPGLSLSWTTPGGGHLQTPCSRGKRSRGKDFQELIVETKRRVVL